MNMSNTSRAEIPAQSDKPEWAMSGRELRGAEGQIVRRRRWPWVVVALAVAGAGGYYFYTTQSSSETAIVAETPAPVMQLNPKEYAVIEPRLLERTVKVTGPLTPAKQAQLSSQVGGRVEQVTVRPGDGVREGDILVQVNVENLTIQLNQQRASTNATRAQLALAESQLARTSTLSERGLSSSSVLEQNQSSADALRANLAAQEAQIEAAEISLRNATVRAPFDGIVSSRSVEPGQFISTGAPLIGIVDLAEMEMRAMAPVGSGSLIAPGQRVSVAVDGIPRKQFEGDVARINPIAQEGTRTIPVYLSLDNAEGLLRGGMFATGQVVVSELDNGIAVPAAAVREDAKGNYVLAVEDSQLVRRAVEAGEEWDGGRLIGIVSGLKSGDKVVIAPLPELKAGDKIQTVGE